MVGIRRFGTLAMVGTLISIGLAAAQVPLSGPGDRQVEQVLRRLEQDGDLFARSVDRALSQVRPSDPRPERLRQFVTELQEVTVHFRDHFDRRQIGAFDVEEVLRRGAAIDRVMQSRPLNPRADTDWGNLHRDLDELARTFRIAWDWNNPRPTPVEPEGGPYQRLSGTYRLERNRSDDPRQVADQASRGLPGGQRQRVFQNLMDRLDAPEVIAIDRHGSNVTIASSTAPRLDFEADGRVRAERLPGGQMMETRVTLYGDQLRVSTTGSRGNDFTVTFEPVDNGVGLRVTRRISSDGLRQPVTAQSFYRRSSDRAQWDVYGGPPQVGYEPGPAPGDFVIPDGTRFVATLDRQLSTRASRDGERFSLTIRGSSLYDGAVIEGSVSGVNSSGRARDRAEMSLNFQSIRLRDGRTGRFSGYVDSVRTPGGETVRVDNEGRVGEDGRGEKALERGALGAALGALVGAVAGGGKGAAIGAAIGAGVGASTVFMQGRDQLDLGTGTEFSISSVTPRR